MVHLRFVLGRLSRDTKLIGLLMRRLVLPLGVEPRFAASETAALSIELRERYQGWLAFAEGIVRQQRKRGQQ